MSARLLSTRLDPRLFGPTLAELPFVQANPNTPGFRYAYVLAAGAHHLHLRLGSLDGPTIPLGFVRRPDADAAAERLSALTGRVLVRVESHPYAYSYREGAAHVDRLDLCNMALGPNGAPLTTVPSPQGESGDRND